MMQIIQPPGGGAEYVGPLEAPGLLAWWKADAITGLSDGSALTQAGGWPDSSGNGFGMGVPNDAAARPIYKTNVINGKPVVRFSGSHYLYFQSLAPRTIFFVSKKAVLDTGHNVVLYKAGSRLDSYEQLICYSNTTSGPGSLAAQINSSPNCQGNSPQVSAVESFHVFTVRNKPGVDVQAGARD